MSVLNRVLAALPWSLAVLAASAEPYGSVRIDEWEVPFRMGHDGKVYDTPPAQKQEETRPRDPWLDSRGRVWFAGQMGNYVAVLEPESGDFRRYEVSGSAHPHSVIVDTEDAVWYSGNLDGHIGRLDPETGKIRRFPTAHRGAADPHTMAWDQHGDLWFTAQFSGLIGKLTVATGEVDVVKIRGQGARVYGIKLDSRHFPWVSLFGTNKLVRVNPKSMEATEFLLPKGARPRRIALTSDDRVWYTDYAQGQLGRLDPATGEVRVWESPGGANSVPYGIAVDARDRLWYVEAPLTQCKLVGFDTKAERFFSLTPFESGGRAVRHMYYHEPTNTLWMGTDANTIARARLP